MTKNLVLVLMGISIGAVAMRSYDSSSSSELSEDVQQQSMSLPGASEDSQVEAAQQLDLQNAASVQTENPAPQQIAAAERGVAEDPLENSTVPNQIETADVAGVSSPEIETQTENSPQPLVAEDRGLPPLLPEEYDFMLEPPEERPISAAERARIFAAEARDETWAYTMELGINQHVAVATPVGTTIEYVECRTNACMIAGYVQPGFEDRSREVLNEMAQQGWYQIDGQFGFGSQGQNGEDRFVRFLPRDQGGETEIVPVEPQQDEIESTTQDDTAGSKRA